MNLLHISASLFGADGKSSQMARHFIAQWKTRYPHAVVTERDLGRHPIPHLDLDTVQAVGTPAAQRTPAQQELELQRTEARVLRQRLEQAERDRQDEIERLKQELEEKRNPLDLKDLVDENDLQNFDAETLQIFAKIADKVVQRRTPKIDARAEALRALQERDEQRVQTYRERVLLDPARGLHNLDALSRDPRFMQWAQSDDVDLDSTLNSLLRARTEDDVDRYAKIASRKIAQYNAQSKSQAGSNRSAPSGTDPNVRLTAGMRRGSVQRETDAQRDAKLAEARRLSRSSNLHDRNKAKAILESIS